MRLENQAQVDNTRKKLDRLEASYERLKQAPTDNPHVRLLSLMSLKRLINQMKEEIILFEIRQKPLADGAPGVAGGRAGDVGPSADAPDRADARETPTA